MTTTQSDRLARDSTLSPSLEEIAALQQTLAPNVRAIPMYREIMADLETPVSAYLKISDGLRKQGFILESVEGGIRIARYSFIGAGNLGTVTFDGGVVRRHGHPDTPYDDPLTALSNILEEYAAASLTGLPSFTGGAVGNISYDAISRFEPRVGLAEGAGLESPEATFHIAESLVVFDHIARTMKVIAHVRLDDPDGLEVAYGKAAAQIDELAASLHSGSSTYQHGSGGNIARVEERFRPNTTPERYHEIVRRAKEYIHAGDIFQVVLSQRIDIDTDAHPFSIYRALRMVNPSPYMFYLDFGDHQIVGASPELLVRLENGVITNHPIAGTRPRGETVVEDERLAADLMADAKERAEHIMLVDLGRNDVGRVSKPGTVRVPKLMDVERFSHVMHIVSHVEGEITDEASAMDALRACFPAGTVSGAPKIRAMEIIAELETDKRGFYSGAVGYIDFAGGMDTCIALRTMMVRDGVASLQAGGGIVADSTPEGEYAESFHKMRALVRAIERAESIELAESHAHSGGAL